MAANRARTTSSDRAREVSSAAWLTGRGCTRMPPASHFETRRSCTPRWAANSRMLIRRASRRARASFPDHCRTTMSSLPHELRFPGYERRVTTATAETELVSANYLVLGSGAAEGQRKEGVWAFHIVR